MKAVLISPNKIIGLKSFVILFAVFSVLFWFIAEKLFLIDILSIELKYPMPYIDMEYLLIGISAFISSYILFYLLKKIHLNRQRLITFSINLAVDGSYHFVKAPSLLLSSDFLALFFKYLKSNCTKGKYNSVLNQYLPLLEIRRSGELVKVKENETLLASGLEDGDICQIVGKPKKVTQ